MRIVMLLRMRVRRVLLGDYTGVAMGKLCSLLKGKEIGFWIDMLGKYEFGT
jgi:hypothetical protein